jgi:hypothetical protein
MTIWRRLEFPAAALGVEDATAGKIVVQGLGRLLKVRIDVS